MKTVNLIYNNFKKLMIVRCFLIVLFLVQANMVKCQVEKLTVICNQNGGPDAMKFSELKSVMKGERQRWNSGTKVTIALMKTSTPVGKNTAQAIYNMSGDALLKYWLGQTYQGSAHAPKFFNSASELESYVAQNPGAIGILDQPLANNDVKIVSIDGKTQVNL